MNDAFIAMLFVINGIAAPIALAAVLINMAACLVF